MEVFLVYQVWTCAVEEHQWMSKVGNNRERQHTTSLLRKLERSALALHFSHSEPWRIFNGYSTYFPLKKLYFIILWIPNLTTFANQICRILGLCVCVSVWVLFFLRIIYGLKVLPCARNCWDRKINFVVSLKINARMQYVIQCNVV